MENQTEKENKAEQQSDNVFFMQIKCFCISSVLTIDRKGIIHSTTTTAAITEQK